MRAGARVALAAAAIAVASCAAKAPHDDPKRMALLEKAYGRLHERLEKAAATEPLVAAAFADRGQVVVAIRAGLIEQLAGNVARRYLDRVTLDLGQLGGHGSGELNKKTFLGNVTIGEWRVRFDLGGLVGRLRAGTPRVRLRGPDLIDVELPVEVQEAEGNARLSFAWSSGALANVVCKDFEVTREIRGRVLAQRYLVSGALRLANTGERLTAAPVFPDRRVLLKLALTPRSWGVLEAALRSQDSLGKCGTLIDPDKCLPRLKELAARGIKVRLPDSIFRTVSLPAHLQRSVKVNDRTVGLRLAAESLRVETATLWSSVSVEVQASQKP